MPTTAAKPAAKAEPAAEAQPKEEPEVADQAPRGDGSGGSTLLSPVVRKLIADKGEGRKIEAPDSDDEETTTTEVPDLMAALEATLAKARGDKGDKKAPAKKK